MFGNANVQSRLLSALVIIALVGVITAAWNVYNIIQIDIEVDAISHDVDELIDLEEAQVYFLEQELASKDFLLTGDPYYLDKFDEFRWISDLFLRTALLYAATPLQIEGIQSLDGEIHTYLEMHDAVVAKALGEGITPDEMAILMQETDEEVERVHSRVEELLRQGRSDVHEGVARVDTLGNLSILIGVVSLGIFSALAVLGSSTTGQIAEPILHLTNAVVAFENDTYSPEMLRDIMRRRDEIGRLAVSFDRMASSIKEADQAKDSLLTASRRFVPYEYLDFLQRRSINEIKLGDHVSAEMAVMFSDIRSFTTMSEGMTPQENFDFVNAYLSRVSPIIRGNDGFIVKFLGDGMMAIFPYGVDCAVVAAIGKIRDVVAQNAEREAQGLFPIELGVGIHTGHMMVGMIGEKDRMQGDAFSDNVNLTSRIEGLTKFFGVSLIISEETYLRLANPADYLIRPLGKVQVKGRERPITLYEVFNADPDNLCMCKQDVVEDFSVGLKAYQSGQFDEAAQRFQKVLEVIPNDKSSVFYLGQALEHRQHAAPPNWDGVIVMTSK